MAASAATHDARARRDDHLLRLSKSLSVLRVGGRGSSQRIAHVDEAVASRPDDLRERLSARGMTPVAMVALPMLLTDRARGGGAAGEAVPPPRPPPPPPPRPPQPGPLRMKRTMTTTATREMMTRTTTTDEP